MSLHERMYELTEVDEVNEFLDHFSTCVIFKAGSCHKTMQTFGYVEEALDLREDLSLAFVRVIESRSASNHIAEITGIVHQSPQFILFVDGKAVYDVDNWNITPEALGTALGQHLGLAQVAPKKCGCGHGGCSPRSDVSPYVNLLKEYVGGQLSEEEFQRQWVQTFRMDATPRSTNEFEALNSLFGDVDRLIVPQSDLKERAGELLGQLASR